MNCDEARKLMDGYLDGELDPVTSQKVDQHLRDCRKCEQTYEVDTALSHAISQAAPYYKAPTELRERIHASLRDAIIARTIADAAKRISCWPDARSQSIVPFFLNCRGTGWPGSSYHFSSSYRFNVVASDCSNLVPINFWRRNS